jgi:multimeric flavodoxin WrbA
VVGSSTEILLERIRQGIESSFPKTTRVALDKVRLNELMFLPCQACGNPPTPKFCFFDDALTDVYKLLAECDCFLVGSPIYFDSVSAQLKAFMDRCNCFRPPDYKGEQAEYKFIKLIKKKRPGAMVLVGDNDGWIEGPRRSIAGFFKWVEVVNEGHIWYRSKDFNKKGTVAEDEKTLAAAEQLGKQLGQLLLKQNEK